MQSSGVSFLELIQPQSLFADMAIGANAARHGVRCYNGQLARRRATGAFGLSNREFVTVATAGRPLIATGVTANRIGATVTIVGIASLPGLRGLLFRSPSGRVEA
jgi:hypothetical protein